MRLYRYDADGFKVPTSTYRIKVTHLSAVSGNTRHEYVGRFEATSRADAIRQAWNADPYATHFEDVTA